jgi:hypothetical protein
LRTPLPDNIGDKVDPHSGHVFKSLNCCFTLIAWLGVATTILAVDAGRILGVEVGAGAGFALGCVPTALFCITLAADPPPHAPHPIIVLPFLRQCVECVLVDVFVVLTSGYLLVVL